MRKLGLKDAFSVSRIVKYAGIKKELIEFINNVNAQKKREKNIDVEKVGIDFFLTLLESISDAKAEQEFYKMYANIKGISEKEVSETELTEFIEDIKLIIRENDLKSFFRSVSTLI